MTNGVVCTSACGIYFFLVILENNVFKPVFRAIYIDLCVGEMSVIK